MDFAIKFVDILFKILYAAIFARVLMSWFRVNPTSPLARFVIDISEPILKFFRKIIPKTGMLDFSPLIALIALDFARSIVIDLLLKI